jgi:MFS family permease
MASSPQTTALSDLKEVLSNPRVILSCVFAGLMVGPLEGFADVWGTAFLKQNYGFDSTLAASLPSLIFIGMCFGSPLLNLIAEKVGNHLLTIAGAGVVMAVCFVSLLSYSLSSGLLSINFVLVGACCSYQILAIYKASTYVREQVAGLTTAVANMIIMVFGYAFHTTMGGIINSLGGPQAPQALFYGVMVIPIALGVGSCGFMLLLTKDKKTVKA